MTTNKIHPQLAAKLEQTSIKYINITGFAKRLPLFEKAIIDNELDGNGYCKLSSNFGKLYCTWGINWQTARPLNYPEDRGFPGGYVVVYINSISLFSEACYPFTKAELDKLLPSIKVDYYDDMNSMFYFLPEEAEAGLKKLEAWYLQTHAQCADYLKAKRKEELLRELEKLA